MLAKKFRLPIQNWGKGENGEIIVRKGGFFIAKIKNNNLNFSRIGIVISVRVSKSAVKRNRLKRMVFNIVRSHRFYEIKGKDFLLITLPSFASLDRAEIEKELFLIFNQNK